MTIDSILVVAVDNFVDNLWISCGQFVNNLQFT